MSAPGSAAQDREIAERFWQVLLKSPRFGTSFDRVYAHYSDAGEVESLIEKVRKLTWDEPDKGENFLLLGMILSKQDDIVGTIACYRRAEELMQADALASTYLADVYIAQERLQDAAEALERALTKPNKKNETVALLQKLGWVYERLGRQEKATETWQNMERLFPDDVNVLSRIAGTLEREGKYPQALRTYEKLADLARKSKDDNARVRFALAAADIKIRLGNKQEALGDFERLLDGLNEKSLASDNIRNRIERIFVRNGDYLGLANYYRQRLVRKPDDLETTRRYVIVLVRLSRYDEAETLLQTAIEKSPSNIPLKLLLVELCSLQDRFSGAVAIYAEINRLAPGNADYLTQWGLAALNNRERSDESRREETANIWSQIADINPNDAVMTLVAARLFADHGFDDQAEAFFQKAIALRPDDASLYEQLGHFYHRKNMPEKAIATFRQIATGSRRNVDSLVQLAQIFEKLNLTEEAVQSLDEATQLAPRRFDLRIRLAEACFDLPDYDAVQTQLAAAEKLVESDDELKRFTSFETRLLLETNRLAAAARELTAFLAIDTVPPETRAKLDWKLAVFRSSLGEMDAAIRAIEAALQRDADSLLFLQTAADIAKKSQASEHAAALFWRLVELDKPRRIEHMQSLVVLYRDLGEMNRAVDIAEQILQTGTKNPTHYRNLAELFFSVDRNDRAIDVLRLALKTDPNDHATLAMLGDVLFNAGQSDEALELAWRIFDRAENLEMKMAAVDRLVVYYRQTGRFDQLIARLNGAADQGEAVANTMQKDIAYCTARAYSGISDYDSARKTLESLLLVGDADANGDAVLLEHLSAIAEIQGDIESAIRFREMLLDENTPETDVVVERLLTLYYENGDRDKATALLKKRTLAKTDFREQLDMVDSLLAREEYDAAGEILDALTVAHGERWELLGRKMLLENWTASPDAVATAKRLLAVTGSPSNEENGNVRVTAPAMSGMSTAPWKLGELPINMTTPADLERPESLRQYAAHLAGVVFREHLAPDRRYAGRSSLPKPMPSPDSLFEAQLSAEIVLLKSTIKGDQPESNAAILKQIEDRRQAVLRNANNAGAFKSQYVFEHFLKLFAETGPLAKYYPDFAERLAANAGTIGFDDQIAITLAMQGDSGWENEWLLRLLDHFMADNRDVWNRTDTWQWLLKTLDRKSKTNDFATSKDVWEKAVAFGDLLNHSNDLAGGKVFSSVINEAGNRSYLVRLLQAEHARDFEIFAGLIRKAMTQAAQSQTAPLSDNAMFLDFSRAFEGYLAVQRHRMLGTLSPELDEQSGDAVAFWRTTLDRVQYGQKTLRAFFSNVRRTPEFATVTQPATVSPEIMQACDQYEACVYRVLDFWLSLDGEWNAMRENAAPTESPSRVAAGNAWFTVADLRRQIRRDKPVNLNIVSYLVNRSAFGAAAGKPRGGVCLDAAASMTAIDKFLAATSPTDRLQRFERYLRERDISPPGKERNDFARIGEMIVAATQADKSRETTAETESPEQLRHKAETRLAEIENRNDAEVVPVFAALILIELAEKNTGKALALLDAAPCRRPAEMKARELIRLELTLHAEDEKLQVERETAVEKLAGYQLTEAELMEFWTMLREIDRADTADVMFHRLLVVAAETKNRQTLLAELRKKAENDPRETERLVAFALKIFRATPKRSTVMADELAEQTRYEAMQALDWAGKLDEIAGQLQLQVENAPGAVVFLKQLAELHVQAGRTEEAKRLVDQIAANMPNDAETILDFAKLLARLEMNAESERWTEKALLMRPELFFSRLDEYRQTLGDRKTLELLAKFDSAVIAQNAFSVFALLNRACDDPNTAKDARKLFDTFWNDAALTKQESASLRQTAIRSLSFNDDAFFYPYYRQWMLDQVTMDQPAEDNPLFNVTYWVDHQPKTFASAFFRLARDNDKLEEFLADIRNTISTLESQGNDRNRKRFGNAKILEASTIFSLGRTAEGVECLQVLENRYGDLLSEAALTLGLCMDLGDSPDTDLTIRYYEKAFQANPHRAYETFYKSRYCVLSLKSAQPERREFGFRQTTENLHEILSAFEKLEDQSAVSLDSGYFSQNALVYFAELYASSLVKSGHGQIVRKTFEERVIDKPWFQQWQEDPTKAETLPPLQRLVEMVLKNVE